LESTGQGKKIDLEGETIERDQRKKKRSSRKAEKKKDPEEETIIRY